MTAQIAESILYQGTHYGMFSQPLDDYFKQRSINPKLDVGSCTALWRGYVGSWEIDNEKLYLTQLLDSNGLFKGTSLIDIDTFFTDVESRVFANWFTGVLKIPQGKRIRYVHYGFASQFERTLLLTIEKGKLICAETIQNDTQTSSISNEFNLWGRLLLRIS